ncbi:hypothetical protein LQG66_06650 [Bradyrhizobium ontarionense]|uniref:RDD domain-containing protein n=1 Tax=Bradyrhizobium ontarionense TaxID=2898149 RepID=A0ABY3RF92_9BRAD|nr:hypothetical protein [Bradyrhizobium sp. A19]UFZ05983.1 hypothetical protein LQG66_06650 [Bradyrhizobium sp. A19]
MTTISAASFVMINRDDLPVRDLSPAGRSNQGLRPITWSTWFAWIAVAALVPVCSTVAATALLKIVARDAAYRELIMRGLLILAGVALLTPPVLQALVLKSVLPRFSIVLWLFGLLISILLWLMLEYGRESYGPVLFGSRLAPSVQLKLAAMSLHSDGPLTMMQIVGLPWGPLLLWTAVAGAMTSFVPSWIIGEASGLRGATRLVLFASVLGACVASIAEQLTTLHAHRYAIDDWALNGLSWPERLDKLTVRAGLGAVWGATTAIPVVAMSNRRANGPGTIFALHRAGGLVLLLTAPLLIAMLAPFVGYLAGRNGIMAGAPELRRALSIAPSHDRSQGEPIISYSHDVALLLGPWPDAAIAPDGQTAIVRDADHALRLVDLATGRPTRQLADALQPSERHHLAWSPDGHYLALRSNGATLAIPDTRYETRLSRIRLYTWPDLSSAGEFSDQQPRCSESFVKDPLLFSADGKSVWLACDPPTTPQPGDVMALRLEVPTLRVGDIAYFGAAADSGVLRGLKRVESTVWAWQLPEPHLPFRIHDLTRRREVVAVSPPPELTRGLTAQFADIDRDDTARLKYCGVPATAPVSTGPLSWICRILIVDTRTGALIGHEDEPNNLALDPANVRLKRVISGHGLRIEALWQITSKGGELVVRDEATGRERQRIASIAQRPLQMSDDGRWLMTSTIYGSSLRLYRLRP